MDQLRHSLLHIHRLLGICASNRIVIEAESDPAYSVRNLVEKDVSDADLT